MHLIVGLGNPGLEYEKTRHNMGFRALDLLASDLEVEHFKTGFDSLWAKVRFRGEEVLLAKPQTFMNLSGEAVRKLFDYYKFELDDLLVISDDLALPPGAIRLRPSGSSGGQKGLQNIIDRLGSNQFKRLRIGIGEPDRPTVDYVLGQPSPAERELIDQALERAAEAVLYYLVNGFAKASSRYNGQR